MSGITQFIFFAAAFIILVFGGLVVLDSATDSVIGTLSYYWETQVNDTVLDFEYQNMTFELERISSRENPYVVIEYVGGNVSDRVYINENLIGNLTPPSPDTIYFAPGLLAVNTNLSVDLINETSTNLTRANLTYYRYDGCNLNEQTCNTVQTSSEISAIIWYVLAGLMLVVVCVMVLQVLRG